MITRSIITTDDGSHSLYVPIIDENYHSTHGAIQESLHVFIESGLNYIDKAAINILEIGFGTGLNAILSFIEGEKKGINIRYFGIEKYPLNENEYQLLNYTTNLGYYLQQPFLSMHQQAWEIEIPVTNNFSLCKRNGDANKMNLNELPPIDLIYFDAFAPNKQNDLWNTQLFQKIYDNLNIGGVFVTYCAKGVVRRALQEVGFTVERIPGPPGKKEMLRAIK